MSLRIVHLTVAMFAACLSLHAQDKAELQQLLLFHASFDGSAEADFSGSDGKIYTAENIHRTSFREGLDQAVVEIAKDEGRYGDCLRFKKKSESVVFYKAFPNRFHASKNWSGTVSFWLRLDPDKDLEPGYCDPIQITDKAWNNAAFFVDFDKDLPRDFRLGVFSNLSDWNPSNKEWDSIPVSDRPMVTVKHPRFRKDQWTHVVFTFDKINAEDGSDSVAKLFLNGELQGFLKGPIRFDWSEPTTSDPLQLGSSPAAIMLGLNYIGDFDDLAIFSRALTLEEVQLLRSLRDGLK